MESGIERFDLPSFPMDVQGKGYFYVRGVFVMERK
jgi:hypothetical protein